jgi:hypothetical protein
MDPAEPRAQYYGAWDAFAADQASRLKDEEAAEAAAEMASVAVAVALEIVEAGGGPEAASL